MPVCISFRADELVIHSQAYATNEWRGATPWAPPTSAIVPPGGQATYGVRLRLAENVERVSDALLAAQMPVAVPLPSPTLHLDMQSARLEVLAPPSMLLIGKAAEPAGCLEASNINIPVNAGGDPHTLSHTLRLRPLAVGRCRLELTYSKTVGEASRSQIVQYVHLHILEPAAQLLQRHGDFAASVGWLAANASDPWHRGPGFMGTDAEGAGGKGAALLEDPRVFMAGMSDEAGASAPLAMSVKQLGLPSASEVALLEEYVHGTLWAGKDGKRSDYLQGSDYSVRLSMLYWSDSIDATPAGPAWAALPALAKTCHKCWATCSKKRE